MNNSPKSYEKNSLEKNAIINNKKHKNSDNAQKNEKTTAKYIKCQKTVALIYKRCYSKATKTIK